MSSLIQRYKPSYKSKAKIPKKYFEGLNAKERKLMTKEILERPQSLKYWSADKAYSKRLRKEKESLPKSKYTLAFHKKYGKEAAKSLQTISKATGIRLAILKEVHKRGIGAWNGSHRPGVYPNQWAKGRVMSFVVGGKTQKTTDRDLWELHLKDLKKRRKNPADFIQDFNDWLDIQPFKDKVSVSIRKRTKDIYISYITVRESKYLGIGKQIMKKLIELSDTYKVPLTLEADGESEDSDWIEGWYLRLGFEYTDDCGDYGPIMTRYPEGN